MKEIEKIIAAYDQVDWSIEKAALGTVVKVEESAYRRVGARMFVTSRGNWIGGISGGCLEGDALKRAQIAINKNQSSVIVYDTMDDDSHQIGVGLGCNGRIEVMFTPIDHSDSSNSIEFLRNKTDRRNTSIILQIINHAHEEELLGRFYPIEKIDQLCVDVQLDKSEVQTAIENAKSKKRSKVARLKSKEGADIELLIELLRPKIKLICCGDNYDVNAFLPIATELGWESHVAGKMRKLTKETAQYAKSICSYEDAVKISVDDHTAVVLMSHDYKTDLTLIQHFLNTSVPYIGLLGPKKRMIKMQNELKEAGSPLADLESRTNLFAPVGLDIGAESPEEIALSIAAEIITTMRHRDGGALRKRIGPIHERD